MKFYSGLLKNIGRKPKIDEILQNAIRDHKLESPCMTCSEENIKADHMTCDPLKDKTLFEKELDTEKNKWDKFQKRKKQAQAIK
jgi:hypothetical protein